MKKLVLTLDDLQIESFATMDEEVAREKTVQAYISLMTCSCMECGTLSGCETGCQGGTRVDPTCEPNVTCLPTCAGWTCEFDTCSAECSQYC